MKFSFVIKIVLICILLAVFIFAAFQVADIYLARKEASDTYNELQDLVVSETEEPEESSVPEVDVTTVPNEPQKVVSIDFETLQKKYPDVVAWIYCEDTSINYPIAQGKDNNQYLRHLLSGKYNMAGTIFADYRNSGIGKDQNYLVYGHNMNNGTMFGSLIKYKKQYYYDEHPTITLFTAEKTFTVELIAGYVTTVSSDAYKLDFGTDEQLEDYVRQAIKKSTFKTNADYKIGDRLITFSTCSYEFDNARYVLVGIAK